MFAHFLLLAGAATNIFLATKVLSCCNKHNCVATKFCHKHTLLVCCNKTGVCCDKRFVSTSILLSWQKMCFVTTNMCMSQQKYACHDKTFFMTKLCRDNFFATKLLSWQAYFCHDKRCVLLRQTHVCLSWQKWYLWQLTPMIIFRLTRVFDLLPL